MGSVGSVRNFFINLKAVKTLGNFSYIPLNLEGRADKNERYILTALDVFETSSGFEIVSFQVEKKDDTYNRQPFTYGIFVHHKPKK